jgi:hypothetical protein
MKAALNSRTELTPQQRTKLQIEACSLEERLKQIIDLINLNSDRLDQRNLLKNQGSDSEESKQDDVGLNQERESLNYDLRAIEVTLKK